MKNILNNEDLFGWSRNAVFGAVAVFLLILGIATTAYFVGRHNLKQTTSPIPVIDLAGRSPQVMGANIFSINGIVKEKNESENKMTVETTYRDVAGVLQQKNITVQIDPKLEIIRWDVTQAVDQPDQAQRSSITIQDITIGSQITLQTEDDIRTTDLVQAQAVSEMITPFTN